MYLQNGEGNCAKACIINVLIDQFKDEKMALTYVDPSIKDLLSIKKELNKHSLNYKGYEVDSLSEITEDNLPAVCHINYGRNDHFVLLKKIGKKTVTIIDPDNGVIKLKKDEFLNVFLRRILLKESSVKDERNNLNFFLN